MSPRPETLSPQTLNPKPKPKAKDYEKETEPTLARVAMIFFSVSQPLSLGALGAITLQGSFIRVVGCVRVTRRVLLGFGFGI